MTKNKSKYEIVRKKPYLFEQITGITIKQFDELFLQFKPLYEAKEEKRLSRPNRKREKGGGNSFKLCLEDRLLMVLMYYRLYTTQLFLGQMIFNIDDSNVSRAFRSFTPLLTQIFKIPERKIEMSEGEVLEVFIDGTEQPINRPKKNKTQKDHYSGKKKRHTIKNQVVCGKNKKIKAVSKSYPGKIHDKKVYDKTRLIRPPNVEGIGDTGYQGTSLTIPHKKPKGKELSKQQKKENKELSSRRVIVENAIALIKRYRIVSDKYRNQRALHSMIFKNIAGLTNLRIA